MDTGAIVQAIGWVQAYYTFFYAFGYCTGATVMAFAKFGSARGEAPRKSNILAVVVRQCRTTTARENFRGGRVPTPKGYPAPPRTPLVKDFATTMQLFRAKKGSGKTAPEPITLEAAYDQAANHSRPVWNSK